MLPEEDDLIWAQNDVQSVGDDVIRTWDDVQQGEDDLIWIRDDVQSEGNDVIRTSDDV